jgi:hypothetical protein
MKTILVSVSLFLILLSSSVSNAQSIPALTIQNGTFLIATTRATPPVNVVTADELVNATAVLVIDEKTMTAEKGIEVKSFRMTVITPSGKVELEAKGSTISEPMKAQLQKLHSGDKVYFEYIKAQQPDGTLRSLTSMAFKIQ